MRSTANPEKKSELTNTFLQPLLALRAQLQQSQGFDKIKCKVSFFQQCFLFGNEMLELKSSALVSCQFVMEITHSHVSVCTAITEQPEILGRNINISKAALTPSARGYTETQLLGKLCPRRFVFPSLKNL